MTRTEVADDIIRKIRSKQHPYIEKETGYNLRIDEGVYPPGFESKLLANIISEVVKPNSRVWDYGTGSGYLARVAAEYTNQPLLASDITRESVTCASWNLHNYNCEIRQGNGFDVLRENETFDVILASTPYDNAQPRDSLEHAVYDKNGKMKEDLFNSKERLTESGIIAFTYSKRMEAIAPLSHMAQGFSIKRIGHKTDSSGETYFVAIISNRT